MSALTKGFQILAETASNADGLGFSQIVSATGISKATVHRLLKELVELNALTFDPTSRRYKGGLALASLGAAVAANYDIRRVARPFLEELHEQTGNVTTLGIRNGVVGTYIDKIEPKELILRLHSEVGKSFPLHCTAMGKVLLANSDASVISSVLRRRMQQYTANTITDSKTLRKELTHVMENGYAIDNEEITRGLICIAAPIFHPDGHVCAAISSTFSSFDTTTRMKNQISRLVMSAAQKASASVTVP